MKTKQLTNQDIDAMLDRNNLFIVHNEKTQKYELHQRVGKRSLRLGASEYKTSLFASAKTIDKGRGHH